MPYGGGLNVVLIGFDALSFLVYGVGCFVFAHTAQEFMRYGMPGQRLLVGTLQLCAVAGLLAGLRYPWMGHAAAAGLTLMMMVALGVRLKIKDTLLQSAPAVLYLLLNAYLSLAAW